MKVLGIPARLFEGVPDDGKGGLGEYTHGTGAFGEGWALVIESTKVETSIGQIPQGVFRSVSSLFSAWLVLHGRLPPTSDEVGGDDLAEV